LDVALCFLVTGTNILKNHGALISTIKQPQRLIGLLDPWWWGHHDPSKCWTPFTKCHSVWFQETNILGNASVRSSNLTLFNSPSEPYACW